MPHYHLCEVCKVPVAHCADECQQEEKEYCSIHHPDPQYHVEPGPLPGRSITASSITVVHQNKP